MIIDHKIYIAIADLLIAAVAYGVFKVKLNYYTRHLRLQGYESPPFGLILWFLIFAMTLTHGIEIPITMGLQHLVDLAHNRTD